MAQRQGRAIHLFVARDPSNPISFRVAASPYLLKRAAKLRKEPKYETARSAITARVTNRALQSFLDGAIDEDRNSDVLTVLACGAILSAKVNTEHIRETIARLVGESSRGLRGLPKQIEEIAGKMDRLNQNSWLAPGNALDPNAPLNAHLYNNLPGLMRGWAKALTSRLTYMERQSAAMLCSKWTAQDYLQWLIEQGCGSPCDIPLADLLHTAALILFGGAADKEKKARKFNPDMLAKRRERRPSV